MTLVGIYADTSPAWVSMIGSARHDDGVAHGTVFFEDTYHLGYRRTLLANGDVDAHDARMARMPLRFLVPGITLIDNRVEGHRGLAGLAVADDQLTLPTADRHHGINGLQARLQRLIHRQAVDHARRYALNRAGLSRIDGPLAVNWLAQGIHHSSNQSFPDRDLHDAPGTPDLIAFLDLGIGTEQHGPDVVLFQVEGQAINVVRELQQLPGHTFFETVDAGDAVAHRNHRADLGEFDLADIPFNLAPDDRANFCCSNLRHGTSPPYQGFVHPSQLASYTPIHNDIIDPHHQPTQNGWVHRCFQHNLFLGRGGNLLGHSLTLLGIQLNSCGHLRHDAVQLLVGHTFVMYADGVELAYTVFFHQQEQKIAHQWGRLGALQDRRHNTGFDLDIDAGILENPLHLRVGAQQHLMLLELLADG